MSFRSVMTHKFSEVPNVDIPRSSFDRSHGHKTTFDSGYLVPILTDIAYPGDTFNCNMNFMARLSTPKAPIMDNIFMDSFFFAVPIRLLWSNWEKFNGAQDNPGDSTSFVIPTTTAPGAGGHAELSLYDYMGIPTKINSLAHNNLWGRGYNLIYNEWFRDQNLQNSKVVDIDDGPDTVTDYVLLRRGKRHDYFTSCLPWPQKGTAVDLPLGDTAPVTGIGKVNQTYTGTPGNAYETDGTVATSYASYSDASTRWEEDPNNAGFPNVRVDLSAATASTINEIREAFQIQRLYERDARSGTRYIEIVKAHFNVTSPDHRLQRPEYLGGGSTPFVVTPVAQTSSTDATTPQGNLSAFGHVNGSHGFSTSFTEHCIVIGLVNVRADLTYQQGLDRMYSYSTRWDMYWPGLAGLGEQSVLNKEIYADGSANDDLVFGYQERYGEMRYKNSRVTGRFRSNSAVPLDVWHLSQDFSALPVLGDTFIQDDPPIDRVVAVSSEPQIIFDSYFEYRCARPMPLFGVPGMIDHF